MTFTLIVLRVVAVTLNMYEVYTRKFCFPLVS